MSVGFCGSLCVRFSVAHVPNDIVLLERPLQWFRPALEALERIRDKDTETYMTFYDNVKQRHEAGIAKDCMATYSFKLSKGGSPGMTDVEIAYALVSPFSAGVDTVCWYFIDPSALSGLWTD